MRAETLAPRAGPITYYNPSMPSRLTHGLVTTDAVSLAFSDEELIRAMLQFEAALARGEAAVGVIPDEASTVISQVALAPVEASLDALRASLRANATLSIAVVGELVQRVESLSPAAAGYVHWGATSQDAYDTALVLCLRNAWSSIERDHLRLITTLDALAVKHGASVMLGRTLLQAAVPTTFGLKAAGWLGAVSRSWRAWSDAYDRTQVVQFGGAAGTLSALGTHGPAVEQALADELGLQVPDAPWHAHRDRMAGFVATAGVYVGSLAKIARDISLLMQPEVGEAYEAGGGSSTMPHKRNPSKCVAVLACAHRMPGLVSTMLTTMTQEHERAAGGWQAEGSTLVDAVQAAAAAVAAMADVLESLSVDETRMRQNVDATRGVIFAERLRMKLVPALGRHRAAALVKAAVEETERSHRTLGEVVAATPELSGALDEHQRAELDDSAPYLGSADVFRARLRSKAAVPGSRKH